MFTENEIKEKAEWLALANFLSEWPKDMGFDEILDTMSDQNLDSSQIREKGIDVWCPFEYHDPSDVAGYIQDLFDNIVWKFTNK